MREQKFCLIELTYFLLKRNIAREERRLQGAAGTMAPVANVEGQSANVDVLQGSFK